MVLDFDRSERVESGLARIARRVRDGERAAGCDVHAEGGRHRVDLWGVLPFEWCGNHSLHCHAAGISIVSLDARHLGHARWVASILLEATPRGPDPSALDHLAMARHRPALVPTQSAVEVESFALHAGDEESPWPRLHVRARDRLGLLAGVFGTVLEAGLRPREIRARTHEGWAEDLIVLDGGPDLSPSERSLARLHSSFRASTHREGLRAGGSSPE